MNLHANLVENWRIGRDYEAWGNFAIERGEKSTGAEKVLKRKLRVNSPCHGWLLTAIGGQLERRVTARGCWVGERVGNCA